MTTGYDTAQAEIKRLRELIPDTTSLELRAEFEARIAELEKVKPQ